MAVVFSKKLRGWRFVLFNLCLGLGHAVVLFNAGAYIAMLPRVAGGLGIPPSYATWTQTDYMVGLALAFPVGGWLSQRLGEYRPFVWAFVAFAAASAVCAYGTSLYGFLTARIVLGFAGGLTLPLGQSMLLKEYPDRRRTVGIGVWSLFTLTPFTLGPPLGGWIADELGWRWLFVFNIPVALAIGGIVGALLYRRGALRIRRRFDLTGFVLFALALACFQTLLNQGNDWDWNHSVYLMALLWVGVAVTACWIVWELSVRRPFLDIRLFGQRNVAIGAFILFVGFVFFQGLLSLLVVQLQLALGYPSFAAGLVFLPMAIFAKPVAGVFHEIVKRTDARWPASLSLAGFAVAYFWLSRFDDPDAFAQLFWPKLLEGACLGSLFVPLTALLLHGLPPERQGRAVELATTLRIFGGAVGIALQGIILYRRAPLHLTRFGEDRTPWNHAFGEALNTMHDAGLSTASGIAHLGRMAARQAAVRAIDDAFFIAACVFAGLSVLVWLAHPTRQTARRSIAKTLRRRALALLAREV